jgi:hydroxymethylglutaryl-CoA reductase
MNSPAPHTNQLLNAKSDIISKSNLFCQGMESRGGGVADVTIRKVPRMHRSVAAPGIKSWVVVHLHLDVCDAMGANCASTVAEGIAPFLADMTQSRIGFRIVSNLCPERTAKA